MKPGNDPQQIAHLLLSCRSLLPRDQISTVNDYANFCQMMVDGGQFKGRRLLKPETVKLMFTDQLNGAGGPFKFGLGFAIAEIQVGSGNSRRKAEQY